MEAAEMAELSTAAYEAVEEEAQRLDMPAVAFAMGISPKEWRQLGEQAKRIITTDLPEFVRHFVGKNIHYGPDNANVLGPAGQFADIWRKIGPLKRALWEGAELTGEQPPEICRDLIGHSFLTIDMLNQGVDRRGA
jgi:hypothetical protein